MWCRWSVVVALWALLLGGMAMPAPPVSGQDQASDPVRRLIHVKSNDTYAIGFRRGGDAADFSQRYWIWMKTYSGVEAAREEGEALVTQINDLLHDPANSSVPTNVAEALPPIVRPVGSHAVLMLAFRVREDTPSVLSR